MPLPHLRVCSDVSIVVAIGLTGPWYLQPFMKCHYHFFILWNWWQFRRCFSDVSNGTVGPDCCSEMTASSFVSDACHVGFHCHAVGLVLRKWNWLYVSGCEWNSLCGTGASVCLVTVLKYVVIENKCGEFNNVTSCHMFVWLRDPYMLNIIYNKPTRCNSDSIVFINNYKYALHVSDAVCVHHQEHYKL